jgi:hypothetical protein
MIDISRITDGLYVGSRIGHEHADEVRLLQFDLIISMIGRIRPAEVYTMPPFRTLWIRTYDSFLTPIPISKLMLGVEAARPVLLDGGKVLVFCVQGRRRSVTMAAALLISLGYTSQDAIELLLKGRQVADPRRFYVRRKIEAFERYWKTYGKRADQETALDHQSRGGTGRAGSVRVERSSE